MTTKKKSLADVGTVLRKITDTTVLRPWAEYMAGVDPWKSLEINADALASTWADPGAGWHFYTAADPKSAKVTGFDNEHGLIVFRSSGRSSVESLLRASLPAGPAGIDDGGYIHTVATKVRHKGVGKYLLHAAERVLSEKHSHVFLFVGESNHAAQRFYKTIGYEEIARASDCFKAGNTELLLMKVLR